MLVNDLFEKSHQLACSAILCLVIVLPSGCGKESDHSTPQAFDRTDIEQEVVAFCGNCHQVPDPGLLAKEDWIDAVGIGFDVYNGLGRTDLKPPPMFKAVEYFRSQAPEKLSFPETTNTPSPLLFTRREIAQPARLSGGPLLPAISRLGNLKTAGTNIDMLYGCDMRSGSIFISETAAPGSDSNSKSTTGQATDASLSLVNKSTSHNPARIRPTDLDGDGKQDWVVSDLGNFLVAADHDYGRVVWLKPNEFNGRLEQSVIQEEIGRVADTSEGDFDGDGDNDLVVAEFGWQVTGSVFLLENTPNGSGTPSFTRRDVDDRHGAVQTESIDFDKDGKLDFIVLYGQEIESVELFRNRGNFEFDKITLFHSEAPTFGSSGFEIADLEGDGDQDIVLTNGDAFDVPFIRPYQGVQWLENKGVFPLEHHQITTMPGAHCSRTVDLDGDGDLDIVAAAMLPYFFSERYPDFKSEAVIWLEQTEPGSFERHLIQTGRCIHATLDVGDYDGDNDLDIAVGNFEADENGDSIPWVTLWMNDGPREVK